MLVTKRCDIGRNIWSPYKPESFRYSPESTRMSNFESLSRLPDWRGQYPQYGSSAENRGASPPFNQIPNTSTSATGSDQQPISGTRPFSNRQSVGQSSQGQEVNQIAPGGRSESRPVTSKHIAPERATNDLQDREVGPLANKHVSSTTATTSPISQIKTEINANLENSTNGGTLKEVALDDDEDGEDEDDEEVSMAGEGGSGLTETEVQRRAERRKMKRFRLTHQQTRFLMSEFAKQAHPDASHRERLSREIPGLSPRQVQVWFQNRRAKIKRLTADDRERMMKMRAVPDDFDNVQALHSPYGAVHGVNTPMVSPVEYSTSYGDHSMMRPPLLVDTMRRQELDDNISPTSLASGFSQVGFAPGQMGSPDVLSPLSMASSDRYYPSHLTSPMSGGPRSSNQFFRQSGSDSYQMHPQSRQDSRSSQPFRVRETVSRARSDSLQSPLRSSMSWKGDSLDYGNYPTRPPSPTLTGRQQSLYHPEQAGPAQTSHPAYEPGVYPNSSLHTGPSHSAYPAPQQAAQTNLPSSSRFRAVTSSYSPGMEVSTPYRTLSSQPNSHGLPTTPRHSSFAGPFNNSGFSSAPLVAPTEFQVPRTPADVVSRDYNTAQLSAPMAPPQDFSSAYGQNPSPNRLSHSHPLDAKPFSSHPTQSPSHMQEQHGQNEQMGFGRDGYDSEQSAEKRKRTYSMPGAYVP